MSATPNSSETEAQTDGDGPEGSDKPPHEDIANKQNHYESSAAATTSMTIESQYGIPLPPPESGTYEKQPGFTRKALKRLVESGPNSPPPTLTAAQVAAAATATVASLPDPNNLSTPSTPSSASTVKPNTSTAHLPRVLIASNDENSGTTSSTTSSPTVSEYDWNTSAPSTRTNSRAPSRAPSMSSGVSGSKLQMSKAGAALNGVQRTPSSNSISANTHATAETGSPAVVTARPKPASVHSTDGEKHKFTLKDLLASGPKLSRKSSQRSTGSRSSRKSDGGESDGGYRSGGGGPKSTGGDSGTSLSKKYGICQKVAIGKGATSVVRLAHKWDRSEERLYAIKEFRKRRKNETEKEYVKKLTAEFCISSTLHHTNIVETVDLVQDEGQHWCEVMEFCPGGDLYAAIKKGGMSPSEVECCFKQILCGVEYLHSQGVAHRDIKPENLFFDTKGHLKIGDYGASTVYRLPWEATIHMSTGLCGSEPYIAPEQFLGKPYDARLVDIWACGVVYYCLHFSELPWRAAQKSDQLFVAYAEACKSSQPAQSACPPTINNLSPRVCRTLLRRMLEPDPKLRATIEEVMKHSWIQGIEVCHEVADPKHVHVHARQLAEAQLRELRDEMR
ncbi:hypothetical protein D9757_007338 [Collybiopsis confluens]|uniref:non-specific serine/threonine protein kinase n=1 Tax=Collybiopsis confluens TaxID=2823264 RepID=A0A8H5HGD1_9AGAR|nr:hypothetical protein D9757_007338 [Collybiopsis confluens]